MTNSSRFPEGNEKQIPAGTNILWRGIHFPNTPSGLNGYKAVNENDPFCETTSNKKLLLGCLKDLQNKHVTTQALFSTPRMNVQPSQLTNV